MPKGVLWLKNQKPYHLARLQSKPFFTQFNASNSYRGRLKCRDLESFLFVHPITHFLVASNPTSNLHVFEFPMRDFYTIFGVIMQSAVVEFHFQVWK